MSNFSHYEQPLSATILEAISRKHELTDSLYIPSKTEKQKIVAILEESRGEADRLHCLITKLEQQRDVLIEKTIKPYTSALSHIRRLPEEILETIFELCRPPEPRGSSQEKSWSDEWGMKSTWIDTFNVRLMLVCRRWKYIIESSQRLWSHIHLYGLDMTDCQAARFSQLFETKMKRCPSSPFVLYLDLYHPLHLSVQYSHINKVFTDFVLQTRSRWAVLDIRTEHPTVSQQLFAPLAEFTSLRRLGLDSVVTILLTAARAPSLVNVQYIYSQYTRAEFPWAQLTRLVVLELPESELPGLVKKLTSIESLYIQRFFGPMSEHQRHTNLSHLSSWDCSETLQALSIWPTRDGSLDPLASTFQYLTIPSLQTLNVRTVFEATLTSMGHFFKRSYHSSLTRLYMEFESDTLSVNCGSLLVEVLTPLRCLQALALKKCRLRSGTIDPLLQKLQAYHSDGFTLLPCLSRLALLGWLSPGSLLLEMVKVRLGRPFDGQVTELVFLSHISVNIWALSETEDGSVLEFGPEQDAYCRKTMTTARSFCGPDQHIEVCWDVDEGWFEQLVS